MLTVGVTGHPDGRLVVVAEPAGQRRSLDIPLQAASAIFISSPGVKTPSTSSEPTSTCAPREL